MSQANHSESRDDREPTVGAPGAHPEETLSQAPLLRRESPADDGETASTPTMRAAEPSGADVREYDVPLSGIAGVGARLRVARRRAGLEVAALAADLRLKPQVIESIERGEVGAIPDAYLRGYVRTLAKALGVDPQPLIDALGEPAPVQLVPNIADHHRRKREGDAAPTRPRGPWIGAAVVVVMLAVGALAWSWIQQVVPEEGLSVSSLGVGWRGADAPEAATETAEVRIALGPSDAPVAGPVGPAADVARAPSAPGTLPLEEAIPPESTAGDLLTDATGAIQSPPPAAAGRDGQAAAAGRAAADGGRAAGVDGQGETPASSPAPAIAWSDAARAGAAPDAGRAVTAPARPEAPTVGSAGAAAPSGAAATRPTHDTAPVIASAVAQGRAALRLVVSQPSWVEIRSADRDRVVSEVLRPGFDRVFEAEYPVRVVIGYAPGVRVEWNGEPFDLAPHSRGDATARFTLQAP